MPHAPQKRALMFFMSFTSGLHSSPDARKQSCELLMRNSFLLLINYEQKNWDLMSVNSFTAISPLNLMHEDICPMALDKQTSFILLPFHRKWSIDVSIEVEHNAIRNLNCSVLKRSPCLMGILVDIGILDRRITRT